MMSEKTSYWLGRIKYSKNNKEVLHKCSHPSKHLPYRCLLAINFETILPVCLRGCTNEDHFQTLACKTAIKRS